MTPVTERPADSFLDFKNRMAKELDPHGSDQTAVDRIIALGDKMARIVEPETKEERLIKEMWDIATQDEKKTIATVLLRMIKRDKVSH
ncbi:MAG: DUF3243 family protein [Firmicutes bacterium]|nr:DUF3243 family protein [Bacillota bacterium]